MTFCDLIIYNDNPLLIRLCTELDLYRILIGFHRTFATGVACRQGTLTPPDTWSRPYLLRPILFRTCRYFTGLCSSNIPRYFLDFALCCHCAFFICVDFVIALSKISSLSLSLHLFPIRLWWVENNLLLWISPESVDLFLADNIIVYWTFITSPLDTVVGSYSL